MERDYAVGSGFTESRSPGQSTGGRTVQRAPSSGLSSYERERLELARERLKAAIFRARPMMLFVDTVAPKYGIDPKDARMAEYHLGRLLAQIEARLELEGA